MGVAWIIGWEEARRHLPVVRPRVLLATVSVAVLLALLWPAAEQRGMDPGTGLYLVEAERELPVVDAARADASFRVVSGGGQRFADHSADLFVSADGVVHVDAQRLKSRAAWHELERAARQWNEARLDGEADQDAAFPVRVEVAYVPRTVLGADEGGAASPGLGGDGSDTGLDLPSAPDAGKGTGDDGASASGAGGAPGENGNDTRNETISGQRPGDLDPPFPVRSLLLTFAYLVPANFLTQLAAGAMMDLRTRRRGLLLLASPHSPSSLLAGLTLPYAAMSALLLVVVSVWIGAGWLGAAAMVPVLFALLAGAIVVGLLARSQREMTFLLVAVTTATATFLFLPAMFVEVDPVAFLSPVTIVAAAVEGKSVDAGAFLYATLPLALIGVALSAFAVGLFHEERLFAPAGFVRRAVDALSDLVRRRFALFAAGALVVPFALALELFILVLAIMLDLRLAFLVFLIGSAFVEEALKGVLVYAHASRGAPHGHRPALLGGLVGSGFFVGEKLALLVSLAGFGLLPFGETALATFGIGHALLLVAAPLLLHILTATITATQARRGARRTILALWAATLIHASYNATIFFAGVTH